MPPAGDNNHDVSYSAAYTTYIIVVCLIVVVVVAVVEIDVPRVVCIVGVGGSRPVIGRLAHYPSTFCLPGQTHRPSGPVRPGTKGCIPMPGNAGREGRTMKRHTHSSRRMMIPAVMAGLSPAGAGSYISFRCMGPQEPAPAGDFRHAAPADDNSLSSPRSGD